jgi:hypothetical protein
MMNGFVFAWDPNGNEGRGLGGIVTCPDRGQRAFAAADVTSAGLRGQLATFASVIAQCPPTAAMIPICFQPVSTHAATDVKLVSECAENLVEEDDGAERAMTRGSESREVGTSITEIVTITEVTEVIVVKEGEPDTDRDKDDPGDASSDPSKTGR